MRGAKYGEEIRERARALLTCGESVGAVSRALGLPYTTVKTWERGWNEKARRGNADGQTGGGEKLPQNTDRSCERDGGSNCYEAGAEISNSAPDDLQETGDAPSGVSDDNTKEPTLDQMREEMKRDFVRRSCEMIKDAQTLLERRIARAVHKEDVLDELIDMVSDSSKLTDTAKDKIIAKIAGLRLDDIRALSSILATLWDKQALAMKEPTANIGGTLRFEDF